MKIIVFGATGNMGSRIIQEALNRNHEVTAVARNKNKGLNLLPITTVYISDVSNIEAVAQTMKGQDVVISALRAPSGRDGEIVEMTRTVLAGASIADCRVIIVGGAARLRLQDDSPHSVLSSPDFLPESIVPVARASYAQAELCEADHKARWTYVSPSALLQPGARTGKYKMDTDTLIVDEEGRSKISMEDFAVALVDEAEKAKFIRKCFTVGY